MLTQVNGATGLILSSMSEILEAAVGENKFNGGGTSLSCYDITISHNTEWQAVHWK